MSNDFWNQQQHNGHMPSGQNGNAPAGSLLRDYRQHNGQNGQNGQSRQVFPPYPPTSSMSSNMPLPQSPWPTQQGIQGPPPQQQSQQQQGWPAAQSWPSGNRVQGNGGQGGFGGQGWVANTVQMVRRWSGRMNAVPPVDQNPLVRYHSPTSGAPHTPNTPLPTTKSTRWKRSRTMRIAMMMKHRRNRWQHAKPTGGRIATIITVVVLVLVILSTFSGSAYAYKYYIDQLPRLQGLANQQISQTTRIYDRNGLLLYDAYDILHQGGGRRTPVQYEYIPKILQDAQTSAEDPTFWTNSGIDPVGIVRAASQYASAGSVQSGGSTITQQLIKNLTGDTAVSLNRKIPEAALAIGLTQQYSKAKILEMYFNVSPYGAQNLGVEAAAEDYFHLTQQCDKNFNCIPGIYYINCDSAHEQQCNPTQCATSKYCDPLLGLARASLLAGMPQDPPTYDPTFGYVDQATGQKYYLERQQYVLEQMLKYQVQIDGLGPITQDMVNQVEAMTAKMQFPKYTHPYYHGCEHFVNWVISQMVSLLGDSFYTGGFNIRTTIDANVEAYVERAVKRHLQQSEYQLFPYPARYGILSSPQYNLYDAAVVVMNAKTGEVLAMDGSADYNSKDKRVGGQFNSAVQANRQPGSTIKPIIYTTAFEHGWYPGMIVPDFKTYFPVNGVAPAVCNVGAYCPVDYGGTYSNTNTTIRVATADSRNIPAIKASLFAGVGNVIQTAQRFGITTLDPKRDNNVSFALGTSGIPLIQMVGAYQVFANQGTRVPPRSILDIWDNYGHHLYHFDPAHPGGVQVISPQIAYLMTSVLSDEYARQAEFWPDHDLSFWGNVNSPNPGYPNVAAKTGTTDDFKDNWTLGYTSNVVVGVWAGNADDEPMQNVVGITGAAPIWHSVMTYMSGMCNSANDNIPCGKMDVTFPAPTFVAPSGVSQQCVSSANGLAGSGSCDWMLTNEYPGSAGVSGTTVPTK